MRCAGDRGCGMPCAPHPPLLSCSSLSGGGRRVGSTLSAPGAHCGVSGDAPAPGQVIPHRMLPAAGSWAVLRGCAQPGGPSDTQWLWLLSSVPILSPGTSAITPHLLAAPAKAPASSHAHSALCVPSSRVILLFCVFICFNCSHTLFSILVSVIFVLCFIPCHHSWLLAMPPDWPFTLLFTIGVLCANQNSLACCLLTPPWTTLCHQAMVCVSS